MDGPGAATYLVAVLEEAGYGQATRVEIEAPVRGG